MSALWHSGLTLNEEQKVENVQKSSLKIILQEMYIDYETALEITGIQKLSVRRESRCLSFAKKCLKNEQTAKMFPLNPEFSHNLRYTEKYHVNFAHTENYKNSSVPYCQRLLNKDYQEQEESRSAKVDDQKARAKEQERARREQERTRREGV